MRKPKACGERNIVRIKTKQIEQGEPPSNPPTGWVSCTIRRSLYEAMYEAMPFNSEAMPFNSILGGCPLRCRPSRGDRARRPLAMTSERDSETRQAWYCRPQPERRRRATKGTYMLTLTLYRHGQSAANAGEATADPATIPLTKQGHEQAAALALGITTEPALIICSPFLRARQSAEPTCRRYPQAPCQIWPVQEFTYLSPARCANTTAAERRPMVQAYWQNADPNAVDGPGAESFRQLLARVHHCLQRITNQSLPTDAHVVLFGHGQFMQAVRWGLLHCPSLFNHPLYSAEWVDSHAMHAFQQLEHTMPLANATALTCRYSAGQWIGPHPITST